MEVLYLIGITLAAAIWGWAMGIGSLLMAARWFDLEGAHFSRTPRNLFGWQLI